MIAFRRAGPRFHYLQEDSSQSAGHWNTAGELTHYFCDTPDSAWAEFLCHEEITDLEDLLTILRALWVIEIGKPPSIKPDIPQDLLRGGPVYWPAYRKFAQPYRSGNDGITALSAT